ERQGVAVVVARAERFNSDELFESDIGSEIRVFVVFGESKQARLWFRGPNGEKYLLRKVTLSAGLDAVGRELLGQVVESSVVALLRSNEGMSKNEVAAELERDDSEKQPPGPPRPAASPAPPPSRPPAPSPWELHFAARYAATWSGPELGASHGPGLGAGVRFRRVGSFGLELGADRRFTQRLSTPALDASIERSTFHALLEAGLALSPSHSGFVALGPALELSRIRPTAASPDVTPAAERSEVEPALRAELRYEFAAGNVLLGIAALLEITLEKRRYAIEQPGSPELLAAPAPLWPGAVVTLALKP
ncbi:MAG TPA: hypothetical protein VFZ53_24600, partial [Polyangiaceae bacterium]